MIFNRALAALSFFACVASAVAFAKPTVTLHLSAFLVQRNQGNSVEAPLSRPLTSGETVRFVIEARNNGNSEALHLTPSDPIPAHMHYLAVTASGGKSTVQFTVDGKTWSAHPTFTVKTQKGTVSKPADPTMYKAIRWVTHAPLPANHTFTFAYLAQVNGRERGAK